jgi:hypothetical protein
MFTSGKIKSEYTCRLFPGQYSIGREKQPKFIEGAIGRWL